MIDAKSYKPRFVEYGKRFVANGATDFEILNYSDETIAQSLPLFRDHILRISSNSLLHKQVGVVSAGLLFSGQSGIYVFVNTQSRQENELSESSRNFRKFNQTRFSVILQSDILYFLKNNQAIFQSLLFNSPNENYKKEKYKLKDYTLKEDNEPFVIATYDLLKIKENQKYIKYAKPLINKLLSIHYSTRVSSPPSIAFCSDDLNLPDKMKIIDIIQYYLFPIIGVITFELALISEQKIHLHFLENSDFSNFLGEKFYITDLKYSEKNYFDNLSSINHKVLYDPKFQQFLAYTRDIEIAYEIFNFQEEIIKPRSIKNITKYLDFYQAHPDLLEQLTKNLTFKL